MQDLEEVEEWNEYGELKEMVNPPSSTRAATSTPTPSATNTPSKAPIAQAPAQVSDIVDKAPDTAATSTTDAASDSRSAAKATSTTPSTAHDPSTPTSATSTLSMAMRQAGLEAAKKAGDAKTKARQEELERLKANSADLQKLDNSAPSGMPPPSGTIDTGYAKELRNGGTGLAAAVEGLPLTKHEGKGAAAENTPSTELDSTSEDATQILKAANEEMAKAASEASTGAAEPEVLEVKGQAKPEATETKAGPLPIPTTKQREESTTKEAEPQHVFNAKEAEEAANKAIVADEAAHVHIAGSPPPHASPGMRYPRDDVEDPVSPSPASRRKTEEEETGKLAKKEDDAGKVDSVDTTINEGESEFQPVSTTGLEGTMGDVTKTNTEHNKTGADIKEPIVAGSEDGGGEMEATEEGHAEATSKMPEEAIRKMQTSEKNNSKHEQCMETTKPIQAEQPAAADEKPETHGLKTQEQPAASGKNAGETVAD